MSVHRDGKPYFHRKPTAAENYRKSFVNPPITSQKTALKPFSQGLKASIQPAMKSHADKTSYKLDAEILFQKLDALKSEMENVEKQERFSQSLSAKLNSAQPRVFPAVEDDDQSILDQHVSRVFSPFLSPGTISPNHLHRYHHRPNEMSTSMPDFGKTMKPTFKIRLFNDFNFFHQLLKLYVIRNQYRSMHHQMYLAAQRNDRQVVFRTGGLQQILIVELVCTQPIYSHIQKQRN